METEIRVRNNTETELLKLPETIQKIEELFQIADLLMKVSKNEQLWTSDVREAKN